ncbi:F-box/LRR-repeat protein 7-like [Mercenaria mercenaria]|uniref:F-box/LRR-repeat protein 7-like n=1 Tax=Mercenaria mercenaria TaxID=6596 RepID=UPI00234F81D9|nr:F-box/LRR-repeat protein 7-like [Mercenaria mercenaria]
MDFNRPMCIKTVRNEDTSIQVLPNEILATIFRFLQPIDDILPGLALVCRKWHDVLYYYGSLWKTIIIDPTFYKALHFKLVLCLFRLYGHHVQTLIWRESTSVYESIFSRIPLLKNLKVLRIPVLWTKRVIDTCCVFVHLVKVQINGGYSLTDEQLIEIARCLPGLKTITLNACWNITIEGINAIIPLLSSLNDVRIKINSNLRLEHGRSETAIREGFRIFKGLKFEPLCNLVSVLCVHFVSMEMEDLWDIVNRMTILRKLSISNCEQLHGVRLTSASLQKFYIFNVWSTSFISIYAQRLRHVTIDHGMESLEHVELFAKNLRRACVNGSNSLHTLKIKSERLSVLEISHCESIDMKSLKETLRANPKIKCLRIGCISEDSLTFDEFMIPSVEELCLLGDFDCETLHVRSPSIRFLHTEAEDDIITLNHMYVTANHLCKVVMVGLPTLRTVTIQCVSVDCIEMNLCSDDQLNLQSCVIHALNAIGFLRLFDCKFSLLSVCTQLAKTVVLYRCEMTDYVLQMALSGCPNVAHLNLEKCREISHVNISTKPLKFLNLFDCTTIKRLNLNCPELTAINLGHCPNVRLFIRGTEQSLDTLKFPFQVVLPSDHIRWSHDFPPVEYMC